MRARLLAVALALSSCVAEVDGEPVPVVTTGFLTVDWSISGFQDPAACLQSSSDVIRLAIETADGLSAGEFEDACTVFRTSIELEPGDYHGDAVLLDASGDARTTPVDLGLVRIDGDDELVVPIDFPTDSFY